MDIKDILELERKHNQQKLEAELSEARHKNRQEMINFAASFTAEQIRQQTMGLFYLALNDNQTALEPLSGKTEYQ